MIVPLDHTNTFLSGQTKIDVFLKRNKNSFYVDSIKVSPLNEAIPYSYTRTNDFLYTHERNLKALYDEIGDSFFKRFNKYCSDYFLYKNDSTNGRDLTTRRGMKQCSVKKYGEQFSFFLPLWFTDNIMDYDFVLDYNHSISKIDWTKLKEYLAPYLSDISHVAHYDLNNWEAWAYGLDVTDGVSKKFDCSYVIDNLKSRERPLIEQNHMISEVWSANDMIVKNLINLNFIFNPAQAESKIIETSVRVFEKASFSIDLYKGNKKVEVRDFWFNHHDIPTPQLKFNSNSETIYEAYENSTMFDITNENKAKELIYVNKQNPYICHWSRDIFAPDLFNMYASFTMKHNSIETCRIPFKSIWSGEDVMNMSTIFAEVSFVKDNGELIDYPSYIQKIINLENVANIMRNSGQGRETSIFNVYNAKYTTFEKGKVSYVYSNRLEGYDRDTIVKIGIFICENGDNKIVVHDKMPGIKYVMIWESANNLYTIDDVKKKIEDEDISAALDTYKSPKDSMIYKFTFDKSFVAKKSSNDIDCVMSLYQTNTQKTIFRDSGDIYPFFISKNEWYKDLYKNYEWRKLSYEDDPDVISKKFKMKIYPYFYNGLNAEDNYISLGIVPENEEKEELPVLLTEFELKKETIGPASEADIKSEEDKMAKDIFGEGYDLLDYYDKVIDFDIVFKNGEIRYYYTIKYTLK